MAPDETDNGAARARLEAVLAAYGADPLRWPEGERKLAPLLATWERERSAPLEEARATDAALARASRPQLPAGAAERLLARAADEPGRVVSFAAKARQRPKSAPAAVPKLAALSALAASLAFGLYLGASGQGDWLVPPLLAEESVSELGAEFETLDPTLPLLEDDLEP